MKIGFFAAQRQGFPLIFFLILAASSCSGESDVIELEPPETPVLSRAVIGYGVIDASYTPVSEEPRQTGPSLGYLRRGAVVEVLERRSVSAGEAVESWVLVGGQYQGWLSETVIRVYDSEAQAKTAAKNLAR
ncbi:MAG: hypothetical protein LBT11_02660 [Treponema sp.]|jgi:hypothetical protein|nr:hypothetical protein [Treponema sp.]